jgi:hypothetical protein
VGAFDGCAAMTAVTIPASVTEIAEAAFQGCTNLWHILYTGEETAWTAVAVGIDNAMEQALVHYNSKGDEVRDPVAKKCNICHVEETPAPKNDFPIGIVIVIVVVAIGGGTAFVILKKKKQ